MRHKQGLCGLGMGMGPGEARHVVNGQLANWNQSPQVPTRCTTHGKKEPRPSCRDQHSSLASQKAGRPAACTARLIFSGSWFINSVSLGWRGEARSYCARKAAISYHHKSKHSSYPGFVLKAKLRDCFLACRETCVPSLSFLAFYCSHEMGRK